MKRLRLGNKKRERRERTLEGRVETEGKGKERKIKTHISLTT